LSRAERDGLTPLEFLAHLVGEQAVRRCERSIERRITRTHASRSLYAG
jgi:hypothetical protein